MKHGCCEVPRDRPYDGRWTSYRAAVHFVGHDLYGSWFPVLGLLESDFSSLNVLFEGVV